MVWVLIEVSITPIITGSGAHLAEIDYRFLLGEFLPTEKLGRNDWYFDGCAYLFTWLGKKHQLDWMFSCCFSFKQMRSWDVLLNDTCIFSQWLVGVWLGGWIRLGNLAQLPPDQQLTSSCLLECLQNYNGHPNFSNYLEL